MKQVKSHKSFGGTTAFWTHDSQETKTPMGFATFMPASNPKQAIIWLSGLTCTEENFMAKSGVQRWASEHDTFVIAPDTSPRGLDLPDEHTHYDFGSGAGFYVDALTPGYKDHYRMHSYILNEIYPIVRSTYGIPSISLMGHSMGGHGALVLGLRYADLFSRIVAFAPIVNPIHTPWGTKALTGYLGPDTNLWAAYDSCELLRQGYRHPAEITIYQGTHDEFLDTQLRTGTIETVAQECGQPLRLKWCDGYDHSYYFVASVFGQW